VKREKKGGRVMSMFSPQGGKEGEEGKRGRRKGIQRRGSASAAHFLGKGEEKRKKRGIASSKKEGKKKRKREGGEKIIRETKRSNFLNLSPLKKGKRGREKKGEKEEGNMFRDSLISS